ncbi:DUF421 domain-containing protein [Litorisediminicola beolgyonensis]|uniref:DUF421 domain-containing protein n=1 Tax=Litorisediminicola beolgyonensis TaxID=1173614 RepID=A0ABW3ZKY6_9RHOB
MESLFTETASPVWRGAILSVVALAWAVALTRVLGLRSFSKMTAFDFVMTVATGSLLAGAAQAASSAAFTQALVAMAGLFATQWAIAMIRVRSPRLRRWIANSPALLMRDGVVDEAELHRRRVTRDDLEAKLREANVMHPSEVRAVVLETTGDISVLHGPDLDPRLLPGEGRAGSDDGRP